MSVNRVKYKIEDTKIAQGNLVIFKITKFIFRNWDILNIDEICKITGLTGKEIIKIANTIGLPGKRQIPGALRWRNSFAIIRRNWDILPVKEIAKIIRKTERDVIDQAKYMQYAIEEKPESFTVEKIVRPELSG